MSASCIVSRWTSLSVRETSSLANVVTFNGEGNESDGLELSESGARR